MTPLRAVLAAAVLAVLAAARPAAASTTLGLGADWLVDPDSGELQLTLAGDTPLARRATLGARFGVMYLSEEEAIGVPIDARLRIRGSRLYAEGLVGPWLVLDSGDTVRLHAAFGFGLLTKSFTFGVEVGWLDPRSMVGIRLAFPI